MWTGLGFAVLTMIGVSACALLPLASHASAKPSHHVHAAYNPSLHAVRPRIRSASTDILPVFLPKGSSILDPTLKDAPGHLHGTPGRFQRSSPVMSAADEKPSTDKSLATTAPVVVLGPGSLDLRLLTAKLAARSGFKTSLFSPSGEVQGIWMEQMYGNDAEAGKTSIEDSTDPLRAAMVADMPAREEALATAEALAVISDGIGMPEGTLTSLFSKAPQLKRIVLLSKMGVTRASKSSIPFASNDAFEQLEAEKRLRAACASAGIGLSIVRVGTLKGGGAGRTFKNGVGRPDDAQDVGLSSEYYNNVMDIDTLKVTKTYDSLTLGAKLTTGDPFDAPAQLDIKKQLNRGSADPQDDETSRVVACAAVVAALRHEVPLEFTVSSAKSETMPTSDEFEALLNNL